MNFHLSLVNQYQSETIWLIYSRSSQSSGWIARKCLKPLSRIHTSGLWGKSASASLPANLLAQNGPLFWLIIQWNTSLSFPGQCCAIKESTSSSSSNLSVVRLMQFWMWPPPKSYGIKVHRHASVWAKLYGTLPQPHTHMISNIND